MTPNDRSLHASEPWERCVPGVEPEEASQALAPVRELLAQGRPDNGVDLVPWWESYLANERSLQPLCRIGGQPRTAARISGLAKYAATLLLGTVVGAAAGFGLASSGRLGGNQGSLAPKSHYTPTQRQLFVLVLDSSRTPTAHTLRVASKQLAACIACHETALGDRWAQDVPSREAPRLDSNSDRHTDGGRI